MIGLSDGPPSADCPSGLRVVFVEANEQETKTTAGRAGVPIRHGRLCSGVGRSNFKISQPSGFQSAHRSPGQF